MTRLLTRLVERARGELQTARPRLPARFEEDPPSEPEENLEERVAEPTGLDTPPPRPRSAPEGPMESHPMSPRRPSESDPSQSPTPIELPSLEPIRAESPTDRTVEGPAQRAELPSPTRARARAAPETIGEASATVPSLGDTHPPTLEEDLRRAARRTAEPSMSTSESVAPQFPPPTLELPEFQPPEPPTLEPPEVEGIRAVTTRAPEPPPIEVRIGRIEVGSPPPTSASRRPARERRGPKLSLEDYLRRRRES